MRSVREVFSFFFFLGKRARKTKFFFLLSFLPILLAMIIKFNKIFSERGNLDEMYIFSNIIILVYLQFLILILALFFGTSVCSEEVEGKTLTYLATRPVSKSAVVLGKYAGYTLLVVFMVSLGVVFSFLILNVDHLLRFSLYKILLRDVGVLALGVICYTAFFTFLGTLMKKSILFGLVFCFGWENVIQYFPGSTQRFAIAHYLKSLLPYVETRGKFSFLTFQLEPTRQGLAVLALFLITAFFLGLAFLLFSQKEYILED